MACFRCSVCSHRKFTTLRSYLSHLRIRHANDADFRVICGINHCQASYHNYGSLYKHIQRLHNDLLTQPNNSCTDPNEAVEFSDSDTEVETASPDRPLDMHMCHEKFLGELSESVLKYSLKLREKYLLPSSTHTDIVSDTKLLINDILSNQNQLVNEHLKNLGHGVADDEHLQRVLNTDKYDEVWNECDTSYKLIQNCRKRLGMIYPTKHVVGNHKNYFIPITDVLKMLISKEEIRNHVLQTPISNDTLLTSYTCGDAFKSLDVLKPDGHVLFLHLYNDEFEVVNPIGAKRGKHKINATYFTLGNLPAKHRSDLKHIYLTNIVKHRAVKEHGYSAVFSPLVENLHRLFNDGFTITLAEGHELKFYAVLCTVSADNLSSHALGGFRQVFNIGRICRACMVTHSEISQTVSEDTVMMRTSDIHSYHIAAVADNSDNSAIYGVVGKSIFSSLPYFDVMNAFPPDIMHDCMEGIIPRLLTAMLKRLVVDKVTTILNLNEKMASFEFKGSDRVNKPEPIRKNFFVVGSAVQHMCLFRLLPFLVDLTKSPCVLQLYTLAREVMMYTFSRCISRSDLDYFEQKIIAFRSYINSQFPTLHATPKFHFLIHYPTMMSRYGPLREMWCMRYEAKHQYFKSVASSIGNYVNIAFTLALRHQMLQCHQFSATEVLGFELTLPPSGKSVPFSSLPLDVQKCMCYASSNVWSVNEATGLACHYAVGAAVLIDFTRDESPVFIQISHLLIPHEGHLEIIGKLLVPVAFSNALFAYEVVDGGWAHCHPDSEKDCTTFWPYNVQNSLYISLPYHIPSWSHV